jgi:hypothetical protein
MVQCGGEDGTFYTPSFISLGVDISPSTETLNFLRETKELMSLIRLIENFNSDNLYSKPRCLFNIQEESSLGYAVVEFKVTWPVSLIQ